MKITDLPRDTQDFLTAFLSPPDTSCSAAAPLFFRTDDDRAELITDMALSDDQIRTFEFKNNARLNRIYYGGAVVMVRTRYGTLVVPDERDHWFKPAAAGIASKDEWHDLPGTGRRELLEELFIFSLDRHTRYVPIGAREKVNRVNILGFSVKHIGEIGTLEVVNYVFNDRVGSYEAVLVWDITALDNFSVTSHEEWHRSGHSGIVIYALRDDGVIAGNFSGQQGFIYTTDYGLHPTVKNFLKQQKTASS